MVDRILTFGAGARLMVLAPVVKDRKGEHAGVLEDARRGGFVRARVDGVVRPLDEEIVLAKNKRHTIDVVVDRVILPAGEDAEEQRTAAGRLAESAEQALRLGGGLMRVGALPEEGEADPAKDVVFSEALACPDDLIAFGEIEPRNFSFNSPHGACSACTGLGVRMEVDPALVIPDRSKSISAGAIEPWARATTSGNWYAKILSGVLESMGADVGDAGGRSAGRRAGGDPARHARSDHDSRTAITAASGDAMTPSTRGCWRTWRAGTGKRTRTGCGARSSATWRRCPARRAGGGG